MSEIISAASTSLDLPARSAPMPRRTAGDDPSKEIRLGIIISTLFFVVFLGWAAVARLDAAAVAPGRGGYGQRKTVQHREAEWCRNLVRRRQRTAGQVRGVRRGACARRSCFVVQATPACAARAVEGGANGPPIIARPNSPSLRPKTDRAQKR